MATEEITSRHGTDHSYCVCVQWADDAYQSFRGGAAGEYACSKWQPMRRGEQYPRDHESIPRGDKQPAESLLSISAKPRSPIAEAVLPVG